MKYATRINSFIKTGNTLLEALEKIGKVEGVDFIDLNYPEHFAEIDKAEIKEALHKNHLKVSAINLRFRQKFVYGEFGNVDKSISEEAIMLCKEAADMCEYLKGTQIIIWLGFDGYDYSFQINYTEVWNKLVNAFREICDYSKYPVSIEYKPYEEKVHAFLDSFGTTYLMIKEVGRENLGMTLDFCHMLMKSENPSFAASMLLKDDRLFTVHLNDGEGRTDDGLMVGTVNLWKTIELFYYLKKNNYDGIIYFDTFPKTDKVEEECRANISMCNKIESMIDNIGLDYINNIIEQNSEVAIAQMMEKLL